MNPNNRQQEQNGAQLPLKALKLMLHQQTQYPAAGNRSGVDKTHFSAPGEPGTANDSTTGDPGWNMTIDWRHRVVHFERDGGKGPRGFIPFESFAYAVTDGG